MKGSFIQKSMAIFLTPFIIIFSIFIFLRGHYEPGGGFAAGLIASLPFLNMTIVYDLNHARRYLRYSSIHILTTGLFINLLSAVIPVFKGH